MVKVDVLRMEVMDDKELLGQMANSSPFLRAPLSPPNVMAARVQREERLEYQEEEVLEVSVARSNCPYWVAL
ncbi:hypothetical protein EMIT0P100_310003 [Pseudomonas sp. IT-P100]